MIQLSTTSPDETRAIAERLAPLFEPGDLVLLVGELGAGKTTFVQGLGRALGVAEPITSPTFTLAREYQGELTLQHLDVYRLEHLGEVLDLALPELLDGPAVTLIEWGDAILPVLPADYLEVRFDYGDGDDQRRVTLRFAGSTWAPRVTAFTRALQEPAC